MAGAHQEDVVLSSREEPARHTAKISLHHLAVPRIPAFGGDVLLRVRQTRNSLAARSPAAPARNRPEASCNDGFPYQNEDMRTNSSAIAPCRSARLSKSHSHNPGREKQGGSGPTAHGAFTQSQRGG